MVKLYHIHVYTYSRSFLIQIFICAHTNTFSRGSSESTLDERYLLYQRLVYLFELFDENIAFPAKYNGDDIEKSISSLYMIFAFPYVVCNILCGLNFWSEALDVFYLLATYLCYFTLFLFPFICAVSLLE